MDQLPRKVQVVAREMLCAILYTRTRREAEGGGAEFARAWRRANPQTVAIHEKGWDRMVPLFDFPKGRWERLRISNVIEGTFAAVRLRTDAARRFRKTANHAAMIWEMLLFAGKRF